MKDKLNGKQISLVLGEPKHIPELLKIIRNRKSMSRMREFGRFRKGGWTKAEAKEWVRSWRKRHRAKDGTFWIALDENGSVAGFGGFVRFNLKARNAEFGYALHHPYWGKGIAAEIYLLALEYGFKDLNLHRIEFMTLWNNVRMRSFFEKAGVPFEGLRRGAVLENGRPTDQAVYAVLRNEWPIVKKKLERRRDRRRSS